jgi:ABC-2 type transport system permease protein
MKNLLKTFWQIIFREIVIFKKIIFSKAIDLTTMVFTNILVFTVLMPFFGLQKGYGPFIVIGLIPALCLFEAIPRTSTLVMDLTESKKISYIVLLPLPSFLSLGAIPIGWAICGGLYSILILPIAKIFLFNQLDLSNFSLIKFLLSFISIQLMLAYFSFFLTALIKDMKYMSWIWARIVNPLFMLGGYFYTFQAVYSVSKIAGIINLFNPLMLSSESIRAAVFGQSGYFSFWLSILGLWIFILFFSFFGIMKIKKRLDCV